MFFGFAVTNVPVSKKEGYDEYIADISDTIQSLAVITDTDSYAHRLSKMGTCQEAQNFPSRIYSSYVKSIELSNIFIAEMSFPSFGLGIEMQMAASMEIPIVGLLNPTFTDSLVPSKMILGLPTFKKVIPMNDETDFRSCIISTLEDIGA